MCRSPVEMFNGTTMPTCFRPEVMRTRVSPPTPHPCRHLGRLTAHILRVIPSRRAGRTVISNRTSTSIGPGTARRTLSPSRFPRTQWMSPTSRLQSRVLFPWLHVARLAPGVSAASLRVAAGGSKFFCCAGRIVHPRIQNSAFNQASIPYALILL